MLGKTLKLACAAYKSTGGDSHRLISRCHHGLTNPRAWELSTPSRALPVLSVLASSDVFVEGITEAAGPSLRNMAPCLTHAELSMLDRVASFFSATTTNASSPSPTAVAEIAGASPHTVSPGEQVQRLYWRATKNNAPFTLPEVMSADAFLHELPLVESAMLLELFASAKRQAGTCLGREPQLIRRLTTLLNSQVALQFDVVLSTLCSVQGWLRNGGEPLKEDLTPLFASCARHVHQHLLDTTMQQHVTLYLLFLASTMEKPFIVLKAMEDRMIEHMEDFTEVQTPSMLAVMATPFAQQHPSFTSKLTLQWYYGDRVTDMSPRQSLLALHILVHFHITSNDESLHGVTAEEWQLAHDYLFAQLFSFTRQFSLTQCVAIFDALEIVNASACSAHVPAALAERVKKRALAIASGVAKRSKNLTEVDQALEAFLHLKATLHRCGVLPFSDTDERLCAAVQDALHQAALQKTASSPVAPRSTDDGEG